MIFGLSGEVYRIEPMKVLLRVGGIIYSLSTTTSTISRIDPEKTVFLYVTQLIREDAHLLFGFLDEDEKKVFDRLIKINGVGPKIALAILSVYNTMEFLEIIRKKDIRSLQSVSGIGPKSAGKIMVDISGFYVDSLSNGHKDSVQDQNILSAKMALESLGFKSSKVDAVLKNIIADSTQEIIKQALRMLK